MQKKDNANFVTCNGDDRVAQYFNFGEGLAYKGEKKAIENIFNKKYKPINIDESGLIRIRFIVNCKGKTGRFRIIQMNNEYQKFSFDKKITNQLLKITKSLTDWKIHTRKNVGIDYYQYLIFKIEKGKIIEILP